MDLDRQTMSSEQSDATSSPPEILTQKRHHLILAGVAFVMLGLPTIAYRQDLWLLLQDEQTLEAFIVRLGWFGPLALVLFNIIQIVVAPVPGYVMQMAAGFLYGPVWGGIWGSTGLMIGAMLAMWLARRFGRPLVTDLAGGDRVTKWEKVTHSTSIVLWFILILTPTGDLPYFLAGLSRVRFSTIFLLTLVIRVPSTFVVAAAGAGVLLLNSWQLGFVITALTLLLVIFLRYQTELVRWLDSKVHEHVQ